MDDTAEALTTAKPIPYRSLPGPKRLPLLGNAHLVQRDVLHQQLEGWAKEYGGKFRFAITSRQFMVVTDPEAISAVLRQRPQLFRKGPRLVQVAKDLAFHGVFTANDEAWRRQRQLVMPGLDPAHLRSYLLRGGRGDAALAQQLAAQGRAEAAHRPAHGLDALHGRRDHQPGFRTGPEHD